VQSEREFVDKLFTYIRPESGLDSQEPVLLESRANDSTAAVRLPNTDLTPIPRETGVSQLINVGAGKVYLVLKQGYDASWKTIGAALEDGDIKVKTADKSRGVYVISRNPRMGSDQKEKSGVWRKMKFWKKDKQKELQISLTGVTDKTEVVVLDSSGRWVTGAESDNLLQMLHDTVNRSSR